MSIKGTLCTVLLYTAVSCNFLGSFFALVKYHAILLHQSNKNKQKSPVTSNVLIFCCRETQLKQTNKQAYKQTQTNERTNKQPNTPPPSPPPPPPQQQQQQQQQQHTNRLYWRPQQVTDQG